MTTEGWDDLHFQIQDKKIFKVCILVLSLSRGVHDTTLCDKVCQWLATGWWCSLGSPVSFINKTDRQNSIEIVLKVAFNTITLTLYLYFWNTLWVASMVFVIFFFKFNANACILLQDTAAFWTLYIRIFYQLWFVYFYLHTFMGIYFH
jgi:hypothetical protein